MTVPVPPQPPFGGIGAEAVDQAQQAVLGQGVQNNHYYGAGPQAVRSISVPDTLVPPPALVGREVELGRLQQARQQAQESGRPVVVSAVHGMGGAGKTALARALAAEVANEFPDARIEVDLLGFTPGQRPRDPEDVLSELLALVGFGPADIPAQAQAKSGVWRGWLSTRRVLLILDNARDAAQVRPLLPGAQTSEGCLVVVTSRHQLTEVETAARIGVDTLTVTDACALLVRMAGRPQAEMRASDAEVAEVARLCGCLPLALRPAGSLLAVLNAAELIEVMRSAERPLEHLDETDQAARAAFTVSYQALTPALQEALRACAWHPGPDLDAGSLSALSGVARSLAAVHLARLMQRNMLIGLPQSRYTFHDLFLGYARPHTGYDPDASAVRQARHRLYQQLNTTCAAATDMLTKQSPGQAAASSFSTPATAHAWLTAATNELITCAHTALDQPWPQATALAHNVAYWLRLDDKPEQAAGLYTATRAAAQGASDRHGQANALNNLGTVAWMQGEYGQAADYHRQALQLYQDIGDRHGQANALDNLGDITRVQGEYGQAADYHRQALQLYRDVGDRLGQANALDSLGGAALMQGEYEQAADYHRQALQLYQDIDNRLGQANALNSLGTVARMQGEYEQAADYHRQALQLYQDIGDRHGQANALDNLGEIARMRGEYEQAADYHRQALQLYQDIGDRLGQANAHLGLARLAEEQVHQETACRAYRSAADLYREIGLTHWVDHCTAAHQRISP